MRQIIVSLCLSLAACGGPQAPTNVTGNASAFERTVVPANAASAAAPSRTAPSPASAPPKATLAAGAGHAKAAVADAETTRLTECAAADSYPDRRVRPAFYAYPAPPEYARYLKCVEAEALRDGGPKRLASPGSFPKVGSCYDTRVQAIAGRLGGPPSGSMGTSVTFDNKLHLVDYALVPAAVRSRAGDRARACVVELPKDCPADDLRGIRYRVHNLRTREEWTMSDSQHLCRGA